MSQASNYLENQICNLFRGTDVTGITPYLALFNGNPGEAGTGGTEITTTVWPDRPVITFGAPSNGAMVNSVLVENGVTLGNATATHYGIFDAASGGNMWTYGQFAANLVCQTGQATAIDVGQITVVVA